MAVTTYSNVSIPSSIRTNPTPSTLQNVTVSTYGPLTPSTSGIPPSASSGGGSGGGSIGPVQSGFAPPPAPTPVPVSSNANLISLQTGLTQAQEKQLSPQEIYQATALYQANKTYERVGLEMPSLREQREQAGIYSDLPTIEERFKRAGIIPEGTASSTSKTVVNYSGVNIPNKINEANVGKAGEFGSSIQRKTRMDLNQTQQNIPTYLEKTITKEVVDTERGVPVYGYKVTEPKGYFITDKSGGTGFGSVTRAATSEEISQFESQTPRVEVAGTPEALIPGTSGSPFVQNIINQLDRTTGIVASSPPAQVAGKLFSDFGTQYSNLNEMIRKSAGLPTSQELFGKNPQDIFGQVVSPIYGTFIEKPLTIPTLYAGGEIVGAGAGIFTTIKEAELGEGIIGGTFLRGVGSVTGKVALAVPIVISGYEDIVTSSSPGEIAGKLISTAGEFYVFGKGFEDSYKRITEPIITKFVPQKVTNVAKEIGYNLELPQGAELRYETIFGTKTIKEGEIVPISERLEQYTRVEPPKAEITTRGRQILGYEPKQEFGYISEPYTIRTSKLFSSPIDEIYSSATVGHGRGTLDIEIGGTSGIIPRELINIERMTPVERKLFSELAGTQTSTKIPIPEDINPLSFFSEEGQFIAGEVSKKRFITRLGVTRPGTRTSRVQYLAYVRDVPSEREGIRKIVSDIVYKDITQPFARATGRIPSQRAYTLFRETPIKVPKPVIDFTADPSTIKGLTRSVKITPEGNVIKTVELQGEVKNINEISKIANEATRVSESGALKQIQRTSPNEVKLPSEKPIEQSIVEKLIVKAAPEKVAQIKISEDLLQAPKPAQKLYPVLSESRISAVMQNQEFSLAQRTFQTPTQTPKNVNVSRQAERQLQDSIQAQKQVEVQIEERIPPTPTPTIFGSPFPYEPIFPTKFSFGLRKRKKVPTKKTKTYTVFLKKRTGKKREFVPIARGLPRGSALEFGSKAALKDISRTFKISESGEKEIPFTEKDFMPSEKLFRGFIVRKGKRIQTPNQFIQKTSANLQSSSEKFQIAEARRLKKLIGNIY